MWRALSTLSGLFVLTGFAALASSNTYQLNSYGLVPGATNNSTSNSYSLYGSTGELGGTSSSNTYTAGNGSVLASQLNTPPAPTLSNGSSTYYNKLLIVLNNTVDPSDATYSIEVSTNSFSTFSYLQANGTLGATAVYQSYTGWGGASGTYITNLASSTTYYARVDTQEGAYSDTNYGASASVATVSPSITFSLSPTSLALGGLHNGTVTTSSNIVFALTTNANSGGSVYVSGTYGGLYSPTQGHTIAAYTGNLSGQSEGFGVQASNATQSSGGPFNISSPYNGTGNTVGSESTVPTRMLYSSNPIISAAANANLQAIINANTPAGSDYNETLTFVAAANY